MNELHGRWIGGPTFVAKGGKFSTFGPQIEQRGDHEPNHGVKCRWACHTLMYVSSCNTFLFATDSIVSKAPQSMAASPKYDFLSGKGPANTNPWHPSYAISTFLLQIVSKKALLHAARRNGWNADESEPNAFSGWNAARSCARLVWKQWWPASLWRFVHICFLHQSQPAHGSCTMLHHLLCTRFIDKFVRKHFKKGNLKWFIEVGRTQRSYKQDFQEFLIISHLI